MDYSWLLPGLALIVPHVLCAIPRRATTSRRLPWGRLSWLSGLAGLACWLALASATDGGRTIAVVGSHSLLAPPLCLLLLTCVALAVWSDAASPNGRGQDLRRQRDYLRALLDAIPTPVFYEGIDGTYLDCNTAFADFLEMTKEEIRGRKASDVMPTGQAAEYQAHSAELLAHAGIRTFESTVRRADNSLRSVVFTKTLFRNSAGSAGGLVGTVLDITDAKRVEEAMRIQTSAMNAASDQIIISTVSGEVVFVNAAFTQQTGLSLGDLASMGPSAFLAPGDTDGARLAEVWNSVAAGNTWQGEITSTRDDESITEDVRVTPVKNADGAVEYVIAIKRNVTEKKLYEERLDHLAHHDPLTGLPNRLLFSDRLSQSLAQAQRHNRTLAVMFLDLDRFKLINDTMGHNAGDVLLWQVAGRLTKRLRDVDTIARMGGDEFTIILTDVTSSQDVAGIGERVLSLFAEPFVLMGREMYVSTSVGISIFPSDGSDTETLVRNADAAMYRAKEQGKNSCCLYTESLNAAAMEQMTLLNSLRKAVQGDQFRLHYQPRVDIRTGQILGVEALLRWVHPETGPIPPSQFIPIAEENGLIEPITDWVLQTACEQNKAWQRAGLPPVEVAINVSARHLESHGLAQTVKRVLERVGLAPEWLGVELTESALMRSPETSIEVLQMIRAMGVKVSLDDFGTGHSSLSKLKSLPMDTVKIDQSFVKDINTNREDAAIAQAIVAMAHGLNLRVLAEGVETLEQLEFLRALECDEVQGYFISRPVPPEELEECLRQSAYNDAARRLAA